MSDDYEAGYRAGVEAATKVAREMADAVGDDPVTDDGRTFRAACLDVADNINDLVKP
jgi:hypothetical protein